jgi:hypothetical protein
MRVPELDWPDGLFQDVVPVPNLPMMIAAQKPLWTAMLGVWMPSTNADHGKRRDTMTSGARRRGNGQIAQLCGHRATSEGQFRSACPRLASGR